MDKYNTQSNKDQRIPYHIDSEDNMSSVQVLIVIIYFASLFFLFYYFNKTIMDVLVLLCIYLLLLAITFLIPISFYRKKYSMSFYEFAIMNTLGMAPFLLAMFLAVNYHFSSAEQKESYRIIIRKMENRNMVLYLEDNALEEYDFLRTFDEEELQQENGMVSDSLSITFANGLLGYKVVKAKEFQ